MRHFARLCLLLSAIVLIGCTASRTNNSSHFGVIKDTAVEVKASVYTNSLNKHIDLKGESSSVAGITVYLQPSRRKPFTAFQKVAITPGATSSQLNYEVSGLGTRKVCITFPLGTKVQDVIDATFAVTVLDKKEEHQVIGTKFLNKSNHSGIGYYQPYSWQQPSMTSPITGKTYR